MTQKSEKTGGKIGAENSENSGGFGAKLKSIKNGLKSGLKNVRTWLKNNFQIKIEKQDHFIEEIPPRESEALDDLADDSAEYTEDELIDKAYELGRAEFRPKSTEEFIKVINRTSKSVLSTKDRKRIAAVMSFSDRKVKDVMIPKKDMIFVNEKEFLGPLMLDKLYKSGFTNFPVVDENHHIKGIIHTEALNALEIKNTDRAEKYMTDTAAIVREADTLDFVISEIKRTNSYYFFVLDEKDELKGFLTVATLLDFLLGS